MPLTRDVRERRAAWQAACLDRCARSTDVGVAVGVDHATDPPTFVVMDEPVGDLTLTPSKTLRRRARRGDAAAAAELARRGDAWAG